MVGLICEIQIEVHCHLIGLEGYDSLGVCGYLEVKDVDSVAQTIIFPGEQQARIKVLFVGLVWFVIRAIAL